MTSILFAYILLVGGILFASSMRYINLRQGRYLLIVSIFIISISAACIEPKPIYDLARHYKELDVIKNTEMGFGEFVFNSECITDANYRHSFSFNAIRFLIAKYLPKGALPFFSISICYSVFGYILYDVKRRNKLTNFYVGLSMAVSLCFLPILYVYSGIRNEIAMAVIALVVYLRIYKKCNIIFLILLTFLAITMHPLALSVIPFIFLNKVRAGKIGLFLVVLIPNILYALMEKFRFSEYDFLRYIGAKFYNYTFVNTYSQGIFFYTSAVVMTATVLFLSVLRTRQMHKEDQRMVNFISWYSIFVFSNIRSYQIVMRLPYLYGILAPAIVGTLFVNKNYWGWKKGFQYCAVAGTFLIAGYALYSNYMWMR